MTIDERRAESAAGRSRGTGRADAPGVVSASLLLALSTTAAASAVIPYSTLPGAVPSSDFEVTVDGQPIFVEAHTADIVRSVSYARFAFTGTANVRVTSHVPPPAEPSGVRYEAEYAELDGCRRAANHYGFSGGGFVERFGQRGDRVAWTVVADSAGTYPLSFGFANGNANVRRVSLYVNEVDVATLAMPPGSWNVFDSVETTVTLQAGVNTLGVQRDEDDNADALIDYIELGAPFATPVDPTREPRDPRFALSPKSREIPYFETADRMAFRLSSPDTLVIEKHGALLFLFADAPEVDPPRLGDPGVVDVTDYGVDPSGERVETVAIQQAIDDVAAQPGGGVLYFPDGHYTTGMIRMADDVTLYLESGALLKGSESTDDFPADEPYGDVGSYRRMIFFDGVSNAKIRGRGVLDGSGPELRLNQGEGAVNVSLMRIKDSQDVTLQDVLLRTSSNWTVHVFMSERFTAKDVKIVNTFGYFFQDGINPDGSQDVTIDGLFYYGGDDAVAVKSKDYYDRWGEVSNVLVKGLVAYTETRALAVGYETNATEMTGIRFEDIDVVHAGWAANLASIDIYSDSGDANPGTCRISDISYDRVRIERTANERYLRILGGDISNVTFTDLVVDQFGRKEAFFEPKFDVDAAIDGVHFIDLRIDGELRLSVEDARIEQRTGDGEIRDVTFSTH